MTYNTLKSKKGLVHTPAAGGSDLIRYKFNGVQLDLPLPKSRPRSRSNGHRLATNVGRQRTRGIS